MKELLYGALLTAMALLIPLAFQGWLQITLPPFSATLGSHVPTMLALAISPWAAILVGLGSSLGFLITLGPVIAARAFIHVIFGAVGAYLYRRGLRLWQVLIITAPIHALGEAAVTVFFGFNLHQALVVIGIGTILHHAADGAITLALFHALEKAGVRLGLSSAYTE